VHNAEAYLLDDGIVDILVRRVFGAGGKANWKMALNSASNCRR